MIIYPKDMNSVKTYIRGVFYGLFGMLAAGCEDFLSEKDPSNFNRDNYFTQPSHAEAVVTAVYESLYPMHARQSWLITELRTGMLGSTSSADGGFPNFALVRTLKMSADHPSVEAIWESHYRGIGNANMAIQEIPGIQMDETAKNRLLGETHFLRAYYYYNLVRLFGPVPLITSPVDLGSADLYPSQAGPDEIYQLIVDDLKQAETSGFPFTSTSGRVTLGAVKALLADVYLTMAGYPLQLGTAYYQLARDKAKEVIDQGAYSLFDSYDAFRDPSVDNTGEYIFMVQFHETEQPSDALQYGLTPFKMGISRYASEQGFSYAERQFVESYDSDDIRARERVFFYKEYTAELDRTQPVLFNQYYTYKFFDEQAHLETARSGLNWQVIRYGDVLLDFAEASNELSGPDEDAYEAINQIRRRAGIPELSGLSQTEFREAIWRERHHELYYEGKVWFDMVRTRKAFDFVNGTFNDYVGHPFVTGETLSERELLFPIPTAEIRNNPNLIQNKGY
ncbi:MAG: RagB/SusD family nutrient uptake outer membrane protein [Solitalea sp.]